MCAVGRGEGELLHPAGHHQSWWRTTTETLLCCWTPSVLVEGPDGTIPIVLQLLQLHPVIAFITAPPLHHQDVSLGPFNDYLVSPGPELGH